MKIHGPQPKGPRRGQAGGRAIAEIADAGIRREDGTFPSAQEIDEFVDAQVERYAAGGRARAATARRYEDGTFAPD